MRVHVGPIKRENGASMDLAFEEPMPAPWSLDRSEIPVRVQATVTHSGSRYVVRGVARTELKAACDRCLEEIEVPIVAAFEESFRKKPDRPVRGEDDPGEADGEDEKEPEGDDEIAFEGDTFELDDVVREHLLLALPAKVLCREECQGICPECGRNRNDGPCDCRIEDYDPRLAGLARFFERED